MGTVSPSCPADTISSTAPLMPVRVLVVDHSSSFRRFICSTLQQKPGCQVIYEASNGVEAAQRAKELTPDLVLMDIGLPGLNGIEAAKQIREVVPSVKILYVSQHSDGELIRVACSDGASGYVLRAHAAGELLRGIEAALRGERFISLGKGLAARF